MMNSRKLHLVHTLMLLLPPTRCFAFKRAMLRWCGAQIGRNVRIASSARFHIGGDLIIGDGTWIGHDVLVVGGAAAVVLGANVDIAPGVMIITGSHELFTIPDRAAGIGYSKPIIIADGAWLGAGAKVLGGVTIAASAMVAAGAVVNRDIPSLSIVGGVPAKILNYKTTPSA